MGGKNRDRDGAGPADGVREGVAGAGVARDEAERDPTAQDRVVQGRAARQKKDAVRFHALRAVRVEPIGPHVTRVVAGGAVGFGAGEGGDAGAWTDAGMGTDVGATDGTDARIGTAPAGPGADAASSSGVLSVGETVRVVLPDPQTGEQVLPDLASGRPRWAKPAPRTRKYTVRAVRPELGEVELHVVRHGLGPGSRWARDLRPGDPVHLIGPKGGHRVPTDLDHYLMVGDLTGLPGIARWAEALPPTARGRVVVEVPDAAGEQQLDLPEGLEIVWVHRDEDDPEALAREVMSAARPAGSVYAWLAGESRAIRPLRGWLREDWGLGKGEYYSKGYWSRKD